jgi:hypothetical protein
MWMTPSPSELQCNLTMGALYTNCTDGESISWFAVGNGGSETSFSVDAEVDCVQLFDASTRIALLLSTPLRITFVMKRIQAS